MEACTGVGEIGLDGSARYSPHFELQTHIFKSVVEKCARLGGRVLSIHSRAAAEKVLDILDANPGFGTAVLHWFTDSPSLLRRAAESGCWFSVGPAMMESTNGRKLAALMPGVSTCKVNSIHHQCIAELAADFEVEAVSSEDGVIEAIRHRHIPYLAGVQWHPEFYSGLPDVLNDDLIRAEFFAHCRDVQLS